MAWIKGREPDEEKIKIPYIQKTFPQLAYKIRAKRFGGTFC